jgi:hypothetical protein
MVVVGKKEGLGEGRETRRPFGVLGSEFQILKKDRHIFWMTRELVTRIFLMRATRMTLERTQLRVKILIQIMARMSDNGEADGEGEGVCSEDEENGSDWEDIDDGDEREMKNW